MSKAYFDNNAAGYDTEFTTSPIGVLQRNRVYHYLKPLLGSNTRVLEVNCGTGHDAIHLAPMVKSYLATDASREMVKICRQKHEAKLLSNLTFAVMDLKDLSFTTDHHFDLLLSNFGGLNCLSPSQLKNFSNAIQPFMASGARLVLVVMPKKCWIENAWYKLRKDTRIYRRNTVEGVATEVSGTSFYTYYYSPADIAEIFEGGFIVRKIKPIGLFIPPSYLNPLFKKRKWLLRCLYLLELMFGRFSAFGNYADHCYIELVKKT